MERETLKETLKIMEEQELIILRVLDIGSSGFIEFGREKNE